MKHEDKVKVAPKVEEKPKAPVKSEQDVRVEEIKDILKAQADGTLPGRLSPEELKILVDSF